jgi:hypothetical protein
MNNVKQNCKRKGMVLENVSKKKKHKMDRKC